MVNYIKLQSLWARCDISKPSKHDSIPEPVPKMGVPSLGLPFRWRGMDPVETPWDVGGIWGYIGVAYFWTNPKIILVTDMFFFKNVYWPTDTYWGHLMSSNSDLKSSSAFLFASSAASAAAAAAASCRSFSALCSCKFHGKHRGYDIYCTWGYGGFLNRGSPKSSI